MEIGYDMKLVIVSEEDQVEVEAGDLGGQPQIDWK